MASDIPSALLADWIQMSFGHDGEIFGHEGALFVETTNLATVSVDQQFSSSTAGASRPTDVPALPSSPAPTVSSSPAPASATSSAASASAPTVRRRRVKRVQLNSKQKAEICQALGKVDMAKAVEAVIATAGQELHMSVYPERAAALTDHRPIWESVAQDLVQKYGQFYSESSSKADKYSTFQMRWITNVFTLFDHPSVASCQVDEDIVSSVLHSVAAAVFQYCAGIVRDHLKAAAVNHASGLLPPEPEEKHYWRFFGWAVCSSIKVLKRSSSSADNEEDLALLKALQLQHKDEKEGVDIPMSLILRDEGWMSFLRPEHLPFAKASFNKVCASVNHKSFEMYGKDFVQVASQMVQCDKTLHRPLLVSVAEAFPDRFSELVVERVARRLTSKVMNAMLGEVIETAEQLQLLRAGSTTTSGVNLRDRLHPGNA